MTVAADMNAFAAPRQKLIRQCHQQGTIPRNTVDWEFGISDSKLELSGGAARGGFEQHRFAVALGLSAIFHASSTRTRDTTVGRKSKISSFMQTRALCTDMNLMALNRNPSIGQPPEGRRAVLCDSDLMGQSIDGSYRF
jgi:hypothetical protein